MRAGSEAELAEMVAGALGPLVVRGGGTRAIGQVEGEVLETAGLVGISLYEPAALTLGVRAGTGLAEGGGGLGHGRGACGGGGRLRW